ncbi:hypothetical protein GHU05_04950 [Fructobacillus tropaeoli]|uniref:hypothetical protein n=1 Tax=Fructobacillus tropaeoli TaxID=709323 RepID=UPI0014560376|nr:hypothetical protein [Fructobacillus tropaeoli]NLS38276.1 hypothetical protein [Fructobacillus tropaeoli]
MKVKNIVLFFENGTTFKFVDVKNYVNKENLIEFSYFSQSESVEKSAKFDKSKLLGFSVNF